MLSTVARALVVLLTAAAAVVSVPATAGADECWQRVEVSPGKWTYVNTCVESGGGGDDGGGGSGPAEPTCDLSPPYTYCIGESACWANVPSALDPATWPEETRPSPEAIYTFQYCVPDNGLTDWAWYEPEQVSVADLARQAFGSLSTPSFDLGTNPPQHAVVGIETWFWASTAEPGELRGSSAMGVVAIAEPDRIEVDPGGR